MKELLELIVKGLVDDAEAVSIEEVTDDKSVTYEVRVAEQDMGKVIGKQGKIAKSIRSVIKAIAIKEHKRVRVEFLG